VRICFNLSKYWHYFLWIILAHLHAIRSWKWSSKSVFVLLILPNPNSFAAQKFVIDTSNKKDQKKHHMQSSNELQTLNSSSSSCESASATMKKIMPTLIILFSQVINEVRNSTYFCSLFQEERRLFLLFHTFRG